MLLEKSQGKHNRKLIKKSRKRACWQRKKTKKWLSKTKVKQIYTAEEMKLQETLRNSCKTS